MHRNSLTSTAGLLLLLLLACASPQVETDRLAAAAESLRFDSTSRHGSPLDDGAGPPELDESVLIQTARYRFYLVEPDLMPTGEPLLDFASLLAAPEEPDPLRAASAAAEQSGVLRHGTAEHATALHQLEDALATERATKVVTLYASLIRNTTARVHVAKRAAGNPEFDVLIYTDADDAAHLAVGFGRDEVGQSDTPASRTTSGVDSSDETSELPTEAARQIVLLGKLPSAEIDDLLLRIATDSMDLEPEFWVRIQLGSDTDFDRGPNVLSSGRPDPTQASPRRRGAPTEADVAERQLDAVRSSIATTSGRRPALLWLSNATDGELLGELALAIDDEELTLLFEGTSLDLEGSSPRDYAWNLERAFWLTIAQQAGERTLSPSLQAVISQLTGEAGRFPSGLGEAAFAATSPVDWEQRLIAENVELLGESSTAARVRAFDWLTARDAAPSDFDPFADRATRRAALAALALSEQDDQSADSAEAAGE